MRRPALACLILLTLPANSVGQEVQGTPKASGYAAVWNAPIGEVLRPVLRFSISASHSNFWTVVSVGARRLAPMHGKPARPLVYVVHMATNNKAFAAGWAISTECPGVVTMLKAAARLAPPLPDVEYLGRRSKKLEVDGDLFDFDSDGVFNNGRSGHLAFSGRNQTPLGQWATRSLAELKPCWRPEP